MSAGELALVIGAVLCAFAFAALAVLLVKVRDLTVELRSVVADARAATEQATDSTAALVREARADLDRFDRLIGSAEAISGAVGKTNRAARTALSAPAIKAAAVATGTSRAVRKLRSSS